MSNSPKILDVTHLDCPAPILETKKALENLPAGGVLEVLTIDPGSACDFEALCRVTHNTLRKRWQVEDVFHYRIQKGR